MTDGAQQQSPPVSRLPSLRRNRDYLILWGGQTVSSIGSGASNLAFPLLILTLTHSPAQASIATALRASPTFSLVWPSVPW